MKVSLEELLIIRSMAIDNLRELPKHNSMTPEEFVALCWVKAISTRLGLSIETEIPTRWKALSPLK